MDRRRTAVPRTARTRLSLAVSLAMFGAFAGINPVFAACTPGSPANGAAVNCTGTSLDVALNADLLTVTVGNGALLTRNDITFPTLAITGLNNTFINNGNIDPSYYGAPPVRMTAVKITSPTASNLTITNNSGTGNNGQIVGASGFLGIGMTNLTGAALDISNGAGGRTNINNYGRILSNLLPGATETEPDLPVIGVYGGSQVIFTNTGTVTGRIAFEGSDQGNIFINQGTITGGVSLGQGGGNNIFRAVTGSSVVSGGGSGAALSINGLQFAATGIVDGGAGGDNMLYLQNTLNGGTGTSTGVGNINLSSYINFGYLDLLGGTWTVQGALQGGVQAVLRGGTLQTDNSGFIDTGLIGGYGGTIVSSAATMNFANNFYLGYEYDIAAGGLKFSSDTTAFTLSGEIAGEINSPLTKTGTSSLRLNGVSTYIGGTILSGGSLIIGSSQALGTGTVSAATTTRIDSAATSTLNNTFSLAGTVNFGGSSSLTLSGQVQGAGALLNKDGSGTLVLTRSNTYSGGTTLTAGTLAIGSNQALGNGNVAAANGTRINSAATSILNNAILMTGTVNFGGSSTLTLNGTIQGASAVLNKDGSGTLVLTGANTYTGGTTLSAGTLTLGSNSAIGTGNLTVTGASTLNSNQFVTFLKDVVLNSTLTVGGNNDLRLLGNITGGSSSNKLIKTGNGNLILGGSNNSFAGGIELNAGTVTMLNSGVLGNGGLTVTGNGSLVVELAHTGFAPIAINSGATLQLVTNQAYALQSVLSGSGTLVKDGTADLTLFALTPNTFSGRFDVVKGQLASMMPGGLGINPSLNIGSNGTVSLAGSETIDTLSGTGSLVLGGGILQVGSLNGSSTFGGAISGTGTLQKIGTGNLTLSGTSVIGGVTSVSAGRLTLGSGSSLSSSGVTVVNGASLAGSGNVVSNLTVNAGGHLVLASGGTLTASSLSLSNGSIVDVALGTPSLTPMLNIGGTATMGTTSFNFTGLADIANGTYRLATHQSGLLAPTATIASMPTDFLPGELLLQFVSGGINVIVNSMSLAAQYWDGISSGANGSIDGGGGVWNAGNTNWTTASGNANDVWKGVSAVFQNGSGTVAIQGTQTISALRFKSDGYVLYADATNGLSLVNSSGGSAVVTVDSGLTATLDTPLVGTGKLDKSGAGTLVLTRSNSYAGGTALTAGTLLVRDNNALGNGALSLASGTTLSSNMSALHLANNVVLAGASTVDVSSGTLSLNGVVSGAGGLVKVGAGNLLLSGNNAQLGNTSLNAGGLVLGHSNALGAGTLNTASNTTLDSSLAGLLIGNNVAISGDLTIVGTQDLTLDGTLSGTGNLIKNGFSALTLMKASTLNGSVALNQGTLRLANNNALGNANLVVGGVSALQAAANITVSNAVTLGGELTVSGSNDLTLSGVVSGASGLVKDGTGKLTLSGANLYQSPTTLNAGTLVLGNAQALGLSRLDVNGTGALESSSALTVGNDVTISGALTVQGSNNLTLDGSITGMGSLTKAGSGTLTLNGGDGFYGVYNVNGGRLISNTAITLGEPSAINVASGATLQLAAGAATGQLNGAGNVQLDAGEFRVDEGSFSGALSGNGDLYKNSSGTLQLSGNSSLAGATTVAGGILRVNGSLGNGSVSVENGASLTGSGTLGGAVTVANGGHLSLTSGSVLTLGSLVLNDLSNLDVALGTATPGAAGLANVSGNLTLDGKLNITDVGGFGIGVYRLFDYNGALINNGLELGVLPTGVPANELEVQTSVANQINLVAGGPDYIRFWDGSELTGNGTVEGGNGIWSSTNSNWTTINAGLNGAWNSSFAVFQGAAGTVAVDGTQSVTGLQFITDGYQLVGGGADSLQLVNGTSGYSTLRVDNGVTATLDVNLGGSGLLNKVDRGTLVLNGTNTYSGGTRLTTGTLVIGNDSALGSGGLSSQNGTTLDSTRAVELANLVMLDGDLTLAGSHDLTLNGHVIGSGGMVKNGAGTLTLNQANSYDGTTLLNAGNLVLGNKQGLGSSVLRVAGDATLDSTVQMVVANDVEIGSTARLTVVADNDLTFGGALSGAGQLESYGLLTLNGNNTFSGDYLVRQGTLTLSGSGAVSAATVDISSNAALDTATDLAIDTLQGSGWILGRGASELSVARGNYAGTIHSTGSLEKTGGDGLVLTGYVTANGTRVSGGNLSIDGQLTSSVAVASGATLGGKGTIIGAVDIADGGHLRIDGALTNGFTQSLSTGSLTLSADSNLDAYLGAPGQRARAMVLVTGDLVLDGKLNVSDIGGFGMGVYQLINYTGALTDNGLAIGTMPGGLTVSDLQVQTSVANQVNLVVGSAAGNVLFWDGDTTGNGSIGGGSGVWNGSSSSWTNASGNFNQNWNNGFAVFQGNAGTVSVEYTQTTTGLQFLSDGYNLVAGTSGQLNLVNSGAGYAGVRVGSGNTATVDVNLTGSGTLNKLESGTLVLNGNNSYTGGTQLNDGTLVVGSNSALGTGTLTTAGLITLDSNRAVTLGNAVAVTGGLILAGSNDLSLNGSISGTGALAKNGNANLTLSGNNNYSGGTLLNAGSLTLGHNAALGTGALSILGNTSLDTSANLQVGNAITVSQQLTLAGSHDLTLSGVLSGNGALIKNGNGQLLLTGNSTYMGNTSVNAGGLTVNGTFTSANVQVASGASLAGSGTVSGQVSLADGANLNVASATAPLTVGGLSLASTSNLNFTLGAPDSATTLVKVNGNLTLDGLLNINNGGRFGPGVYQLFSYGGSLTNNGLGLGSLPSDILASQLELQTSIANQINLVVGEADGNLLFWNGAKTSADGTVSGGSGTWGPGTNWTNSSGNNANGWSNGQFAVFGGQKGTVTVSGQRVFSGIQFLADGYNLVGGTGDTLEAVNATDGTLAALRVANSATASIDAAIVGEGGLQKLDGGTLILEGTNTYSGGTLVSAGTLQGNATSLQGSIVNDASLIFQQNVDGTFGGTLSGTGNAVKRGLGSLLFTGYNDFSGTFTVEGGVLQVGETAATTPVVASFARMALFAAPVGDTLAADITVNSGAALTGTGTVNSVVNKGIVQPGANGNLTVTGDFTNTSDGALNINLTPLPTSYLAVGGTANLAGTLNVFAAAPYSGDTTYTLLTADGGITGKFDQDNTASLGVTSNLAFIDTRLVYGANDVSLSVARNGVAFADVAASDNQRGVAAALDSAAAPASLRSAITSMDLASAQAAFDSLSGEIHASTASVLLEDSRYLRNTVNDRMRQGDCGNGDPRSVLAPTSGQQSSSGCQGQGVGWITALGGWATHDGGSGVASVDRDLSGFMLGFDNNLNDEWRAGIAAGYTKTSLDASKRGSDASVDSYHLATYLSYQLDAFAARMGAGYSWHDIDTKRHVAAGSYNEELKAEYKAGTAQVFGEVGYTVEAGGVALEPFAGIAYVNYDSDTGREKGGAGALEASSKQDATFTTVGLRAGKQFVLDNGTTLTPRGSLGWRHAFGDTQPDADLRFVDGGAAFNTQGVPLAKDAAVVEAGLDVSVGAAGKLGIGYSGQLASDNRDHAVTVSFSLGF